MFKRMDNVILLFIYRIIILKIKGDVNDGK